MDCSLPGSSIHGISQQEYWTRLPFPPSVDRPNLGIELASLEVSCIGKQIHYIEPPRKPQWLRLQASKAERAGSIPGSGRFPEEGNGHPLQYSCWEIPWMEEPGGLQSMGSQRVGRD